MKIKQGLFGGLNTTLESLDKKVSIIKQCIRNHETYYTLENQQYEITAPQKISAFLYMNWILLIITSFLLRSWGFSLLILALICLVAYVILPLIIISSISRNGE